MEVQSCLGGRVMEEAEIRRCGWLWCGVAAARSRPVLGTHQTNLLCTFVTEEVMVACCQGWERADLAVPSVLSKNCISKPSGTWLWDRVDGLIQIKN